MRTPYNKETAADIGAEAAERGYVVVLEDVRGSFAFEGAWYRFRHEANDGYGTIEWAAALPHTSGKVGIISKFLCA